MPIPRETASRMKQMMGIHRSMKALAASRLPRPFSVALNVSRLPAGSPACVSAQASAQL